MFAHGAQKNLVRLNSVQYLLLLVLQNAYLRQCVRVLLNEIVVAVGGQGPKFPEEFREASSLL